MVQQYDVLKRTRFQKNITKKKHILILLGGNDGKLYIIDIYNYSENDIDFSKKHIVVFNESNPKWKDRGEYISLWNKSTRQSSIDLGEALAIVPTGHYSGSSYTFQAAFWYSSWESFLINQKNLENSGPMNSDQKRMWDISGNHKDYGNGGGTRAMGNHRPIVGNSSMETRVRG